MAKEQTPKWQELPSQAFGVTLGPAGCAMDIGDGSERAAYVNQDYLFRVLQRPHRSVNLMYTYYPLDNGWPVRASLAHPGKVGFAWDYPYDDYFPYRGGPNGTTEGEPFGQIREIRRHGQDVTLTLTADCQTPDDHLKVIARELAPFGHIRVRINHECDGSWFAHNKRYSHKQISQFFNKFTAFLKNASADIKTICCWGWLDAATNRLRFEDDLSLMLPMADVWSLDKYLFLHYAWPFNVCETHNLDKGYSYNGVEAVWKELYRNYEIFVERSGQEKPLEICEFNGDGDVPGGRPFQSRELSKFYNRIIKQKPKFLKGVTYYQFRDAGRLGIEQEDPNNHEVGVPSPFLDEYVKLIKDPYLSPAEKWAKLPAGELPLHWRHAEDSDGVGWKVPLKGKPTFFELKFEKDANLLVRVGDQWFYKKPGTEWVDGSAACWNLGKGDIVTTAVFAPPADGMGMPKAKLAAPPVLRVRYEERS
jgi:hypothetical protein